MRTRLPLALILVAILLASCGGRPDVTVSIAGTTVPMVLSSTTDRTGCSIMHGDAIPQNVPLTTVRPAPPVTLRFEAGPSATEFRGWIYEGDPPPPGGPIEEFTVPGRGGTYAPRSMTPGRTYQVLLNVQWSAVVTSGEVTHVFRLRIEPP